ncbi:hypothetical protein Ndes2437A_g08876 [Nannochloris sp. 'desiccata']
MIVAEVVSAGRALVLAHGPQDQREVAAKQLRNFVLISDPSAISDTFTSLIGTSEATDYLSAICSGTRPGLVSPETPTDLGKWAGDLSIITEAALEAFEGDAPLSSHALDILPPVLATLQAIAIFTEDTHPGAQASDVFHGVSTRICDHPWPATRIAPVLASLRALPMSVQALTAAVKRGAARARNADVLDLPAIVHQLLAVAGPSCRDIALSEIVRMFDRLEAASMTNDAHRRRLLEVEGAVLMHLEMAIKHDGDMGKAWLKRLRDGTWHPTPFAFALSLVVAGTERLEQHVVSALSACLVQASKEAAKRDAAPWLPVEQNTSRNSAQENIEKALLTCARNAGHGQGAVVVQPLVMLAVSLLEAEATAGAKSAAHTFAQKDQDATTAGNLGIKVLVELFAAHKECRRDVLALASGRLAAASDAAAAPFVRLIAELVSKHPALVESHLPEVRAALENLAALPPAAAVALLLALWPLCRARKDISDFVIVLLRKAMFSRELGSRLLAARGFLFIITEELSTSGEDSGGGSCAAGAGHSASQAAAAAGAAPALSQMDSLAGGPGGATLLHELMGFLRRCLAQQPEVRSVVYEGLPAVIAADPAAAEAVAELLLPHVASFCENDSIMAPLKLEACARSSPEGDVRMIEPLHQLLACVRFVVQTETGTPSSAGAAGGNNSRLANDSESEEEEEARKEAEDEHEGDDDDSAAGPALQKLFASLRRRLATCPLEDFNFDQSTAFASHDAQGALNQAYAHMLLGCYEVVMEDIVCDIDGGRCGVGGGGVGRRRPPSPERSETLAQELLTIFHQHRRLSSLAAEGMKGGGKAKKMHGLTQAVGGGAGGGGNHRKGTSGTAGGLGPLDQRAPTLSVHCLSRLLDAIVEDGLVPGGPPRAGSGGGGTDQSAHVKFARDVPVQTFVMNGCLRVVQSRASPVSSLNFWDLSVSSFTSAGGAADGQGMLFSKAASETARALFGVPNWQDLAGPLFRAAQMTVLACARQHAPGGAGGGVGKKEKDPTEGLMQAAVAALDQLLVSSGNTLPGIASLLQSVALPPAHIAIAADLPAVPENLSANSPLAIVSARLPHFKHLLDVLVEYACCKEIPAIARCLYTLVAVVPPPWAAAMATWITAACSSASEALSQNSTAAKALVSLCLKCHEAAGQGGDIVYLKQLAQSMCESVNDDRDGAPAVDDTSTLNFSASISAPLLSSKTLTALVIAATSHMDACLVPLEWSLARLKPSGVTVATAGSETGGCGALPLEEGEGESAIANAYVQGQARLQWENATFSRLRGLADAAATFAKVRAGTSGEVVAKSLTKLYKTLGSAAKTQVPARGHKTFIPGRAFQDLAAAVNTNLTPRVYDLKGELQTTNAVMTKAGAGAGGDNEGEENSQDGDGENEGGNANGENSRKGKAKRAAAVRKAQKDARVLPGLIYQLEEWEKHLIKVGKTGKINLMLTAKRATNWDFKFDKATVKKQRTGGSGGVEAVEQQPVVEQEQVQEGEEQVEEEREEEEEEGAGNDAMQEDDDDDDSEEDEEIDDEDETLGGFIVHGSKYEK